MLKIVKKKMKQLCTIIKLKILLNFDFFFSKKKKKLNKLIYLKGKKKNRFLQFFFKFYFFNLFHNLNVTY